jgi:hypothetical protein
LLFPFSLYHERDDLSRIEFFFDALIPKKGKTARDEIEAMAFTASHMGADGLYPELVAAMLLGFLLFTID